MSEPIRTPSPPPEGPDRGPSALAKGAADSRYYHFKSGPQNPRRDCIPTVLQGVGACCGPINLQPVCREAAVYTSVVSALSVCSWQFVLVKIGGGGAVDVVRNI